MAGVSAAVLPRHLSNFTAMWLQDFAISDDKMSCYLVNSVLIWVCHLLQFPAEKRYSQVPVMIKPSYIDFYLPSLDPRWYYLPYALMITIQFSLLHLSLNLSRQSHVYIGPAFDHLWNYRCPRTRLEPNAGFYTKGPPLVKSNLICPSDKLSWQPGCPVLDINIQGNFCISPGNYSSDNLPENLV